MIHIFEFSILNGKKDRRRINRFVADKTDLEVIRRELMKQHKHEVLLTYKET
jgi:hypothetical protein